LSCSFEIQAMGDPICQTFTMHIKAWQCEGLINHDTGLWKWNHSMN
jgi:hypothetical protein